MNRIRIGSGYEVKTHGGRSARPPSFEFVLG